MKSTGSHLRSWNVLKRLAIACLVLAFFFAYIANKSGAQDKKKSSAGPVTTVAIVDNSTRQNGQQGIGQKAPEARTGIEWSNWVLVLIGALGVLAAYATLRKIERQTDASEDAAKAAKASADAALLQAEHIVNSERAWLTILPSIWSPELYPLWEQGDPIAEGPMIKHPVVHLFQAKIKNVGKTPAKIERGAFQYVLLSHHPDTLGDDPDHGQNSFGQEYFLIPDDEFWLTKHLSPKGTLTKAEVAAIRNQELFLYAFGFVQYRDAFNELRETRVGLVYHFPQGGMISFEKPVFKRAGPAAYNRFT